MADTSFLGYTLKMNSFDNGRVDTKLVTTFLYTSSLTVSQADCIKPLWPTPLSWVMVPLSWVIWLYAREDEFVTMDLRWIFLTMEELTQNWLPPSCTLLLSWSSWLYKNLCGWHLFCVYVFYQTYFLNILYFVFNYKIIVPQRVGLNIDKSNLELVIPLVVFVPPSCNFTILWPFDSWSRIDIKLIIPPSCTPLLIV